MITIEEIKEKYPLHWLVWNNDYQDLEKGLPNHDCEQLDPRGRTPLMLAVRLCHSQSVKVLLAGKCNANAERSGWSVVQEAVCGGDPEILTGILEVRDLQRHLQRVTHVPQLLQKLVDAPDFYVEMKWEFTSWVPLMSRLCPSDVYKVYKRGSNVRIDTTLLGFDHTNWQRGDRSYIFKGQADTATMIEIDHDAQEVSIEQLRNVAVDITGIPPTRESVNARLNAPVTTNYIDMEKICFERNKSGIWGWRSDKTEDINNYECKVYAASNVEFITKSRTEHLSEAQARLKNSRTPLQSFLGFAEDECNTNTNDQQTMLKGANSVTPTETPPQQPATPTGSDKRVDLLKDDSPIHTQIITPEEYFSIDVDLNGRDIGRPMKISSKIQRFKANLWLSEEFPIKLQEQVLPILDLMSTMASPHVSKLKDFITLQLPAGFPVKIEIPLFHVLNACVTFGNVFGLSTAVNNVTHIEEDDRLSCIIDDRCFDVPANYVNKGADYRRQMTFEDEDDLLQFAIQQSLMETGSETDQVDIWEALRAQRPTTPINFADEDTQLQRALQESFHGLTTMANNSNNGKAVTVGDDSSPPPIGHHSTINQHNNGSTTNQTNGPDSPPLLDADLQMALRVSMCEQMAREEERLREEQMLEEVLRLSLEDK